MDRVQPDSEIDSLHTGEWVRVFEKCVSVSCIFFALEFIREQTNTTLYTYGLGKVVTTSGSEHTTRRNRTEVKPDGAREIRWGDFKALLRFKTEPVQSI